MLLSCGNKKIAFMVCGKPQVHSTEYADAIKNAASEAMIKHHWVPLHRDMPAEISIFQYEDIPRGVAKWKKDAAVYGLFPPLKSTVSWHTVADVVVTSLSTILYDNKSQVFKVNYERRYGNDFPRIEVELTAYYTNIGDIKAEVTKRKKEVVKLK